MFIDPSKKINSSELFQKKITRDISTKTVSNRVVEDSFNLSKVAQRSLQLEKYIQYVQESDEIRLDKVSQAKANLEEIIQEDGSIRSDILDDIVDKVSKEV